METSSVRASSSQGVSIIFGSSPFSVSEGSGSAQVRRRGTPCRARAISDRFYASPSAGEGSCPSAIQVPGSFSHPSRTARVRAVLGTENGGSSPGGLFFFPRERCSRDGIRHERACRVRGSIVMYRTRVGRGLRRGSRSRRRGKCRQKGRSVRGGAKRTRGDEVVESGSAV